MQRRNNKTPISTSLFLSARAKRSLDSRVVELLRDLDVHDTSHQEGPITLGMDRALQIAQRRETAVIDGVITTKRVLLNALLIVRSYGIRTWFSCMGALLSRRPTTFLALI